MGTSEPRCQQPPTERTLHAVSESRRSRPHEGQDQSTGPTLRFRIQMILPKWAGATPGLPGYAESPFQPRCLGNIHIRVGFM
jgi:hypothetical protein